MEQMLRKLWHFRKEDVRYRSIEKNMDKTSETQVALSDPDARSKATTPRMPCVVGYNVPTAIEAENHLIVAREVTLHSYDRDALSMIALDAMAPDRIEASWARDTTKAEKSSPANRPGSRLSSPSL